ncbi:MAG: stage III sporulation protein AA [Clostridiales bacterium]|nr:stage III sporulation protein AA [Clostridiales bacterium]
MLKRIQTILEVLPKDICSIVSSIPTAMLEDLEEIRIRESRPLSVISKGQNYYINNRGLPSTKPQSGYIITGEHTYSILQLISNYSIYAIEDELRSGYITLRGGFRVGLAGQTVVKAGEIKTLRHINSFNFRISREIKGVASFVMPYILDGDYIMHTLIISSPGLGKTTLLRDIARYISDGFRGFRGAKVSIVDERSEIAGCYRGIPQNDIGFQTDILDACPKAKGIMQLIRSMSPDVIVTDEIGSVEDMHAIEEALNSGVKIITTAHGKDLSNILEHPTLGQGISQGLFDRLLVLGKTLGVGTLESIFDGKSLEKIIDGPIRLSKGG